MEFSYGALHRIPVIGLSRQVVFGRRCVSLIWISLY